MTKLLERNLPKLPKKVVFCKKCVLSNQRPRITFKDGICSACHHHDNKPKINWEDRTQKLHKLLDKHRSKKGEWDVLVPGSGGKDSGFVAHYLKNKFGMNPLCITFAPFRYTPIGLENFENFVKAGFNVFNFFPNGDLYRKLSNVAFRELGDNFTPFVFGQHSYSYHIAKKFNIGIMFYGEISDEEYGGSSSETKNYYSTKNSDKIYWKGTNVYELFEFALKNYPNLIKKKDYKQSDLDFFYPPSEADHNIKTEFMSTYVDWKPQENYYYTVKNTNFKPNPDRSEGTYSRYSSLDDKLDWLHYYMMFIKFGIGRATSDAGREIREGKILREEGCSLVKKYDGEFTKKYFQHTLDFLMLDEESFFNIVDSFRQDHIWKKKGKKYNLRHNVNLDGTDD